MIWKARLARVVRSQFSPPGQVIVMEPPALPGFPEEPKTLVLPPETNDSVLAQAEQMVEEHNRFERAMEALTRAFDGKGGSK